MNLYNVSIVGYKDDESNIEISNIIKLLFADNEFEAAAIIINDFKKSFPGFDREILIVDLIQLDGTNVIETQKIERSLNGGTEWQTSDIW